MRALRAGRQEDGFTLIELLVAAAMSMIVLFALTAILVTTLDQTQRTGAQVATTRSARTALATIENELHSACVGGSAAPIQTGSTATDLNFITYTGSSDAVGASSTTMPVWHDISFTGGTLTDKSYTTTTSGAGYAQGTLTSSVQLLSKVSAIGTTPVFQYFAYQPYGPASDGNYYWTIPDGSNPQPVTGASLTANPLTVPLVASDAANTVEVQINFNVLSPQATGPAAAVTDPVSDSVSLRLTPAPNYTATAAAGGVFGPCQ